MSSSSSSSSSSCCTVVLVVVVVVVEVVVQLVSLGASCFQTYKLKYSAVLYIIIYPIFGTLIYLVSVLILCVDTQLLTVAVLLEELREVDNWFMLGAYLNVPVYQLNKIQSTHTQDGVERCKLEMLQYWLDTTMSATWKDDCQSS